MVVQLSCRPAFTLPWFMPQACRLSVWKLTIGVASELPLKGRPTLDPNPNCSGLFQMLRSRVKPKVVCTRKVGLAIQSWLIRYMSGFW